MAGENIAHVEDVDEDTGSVIQGSDKYARSIAPGSPTKEKANSGKSRKDKMRRSSTSPQQGQTDSDETVQPIASDKRERDRARRAADKQAAEKEARQEARREEKRRQKKEQDRVERHRERERERSEREQRERPAPRKSAVRPPAKHVKTAPVVQTQRPDEYKRPRFEDDASHYGIQPAPGPRPRAMSNRPSSYYGQGSRPPPSNQQWHAAQNASPFAPDPIAPPYPPPQLASPFAPAPGPPPMPGQSPFAPGTSYPQPGWAQVGGVPYPMQAPHPPSNDYFPAPPAAGGPHHAHLAQRFQRPSSALGHRSVSASFDYDDYGPTYEQENRQRLNHSDEARKLMPPPPPRSKTTAPSRQALRPPSQQRQIASTSYDSDDFEGEEPLYHQDVVPQGYEYDDGVVSRPRVHRRGSSTYSRDGYQIEPAARSGRRHSYMAGSGGASFSQSKYEADTAAALAYQNGVSGGPTEPLTAAALSKAAKKSKSSRSSGSSESRDESDYRRSATTRTTRSSAIDGDDITIKVTGSAVLRVGNAEIQCQDGGEINISQSGRLSGSDKASTIYSEDRRSRMERLPIRARASSQADSWGRSQAGGYEYPRIPFS